MNSTQQATDDYDDDHDENDNDDAFLPEYLQFPIHYKLTEGQHVILIVATCISTLSIYSRIIMYHIFGSMQDKIN